MFSSRRTVFAVYRTVGSEAGRVNCWQPNCKCAAPLTGGSSSVAGSWDSHKARYVTSQTPPLTKCILGRQYRARLKGRTILSQHAESAKHYVMTRPAFQNKLQNCSGASRVSSSQYNTLQCIASSQPRGSVKESRTNSTHLPLVFFPSNAFMASARSLHTFNRGKQLNCSLHAGLSPCRKPQKCRLWTSTQSRNCPSKRTREQESKPKTTQQKQEKHTTKTKTKQKRQREVGSQPAMGITCMMTSYVSF